MEEAEDDAGTDGLEQGFIYLGNETVREQRLRLLRFVDEALADPMFLVKVPPFGMAQMGVSAHNARLEGEVSRLKFNLAVLDAAQLLVARGVYEYGYVADLEPGGCRVSRQVEHGGRPSATAPTPL